MSPLENYYKKSFFKDETIESFPESTNQDSVNVKIKNEFKTETLDEEMYSYYEYEDESGIQICVKLEPTLEIYNEYYEEISLLKDEILENLPEFSVLQFIEASLNYSDQIKNNLKNIDEIYNYYEIEEIIECKYEIDEHEMNNYLKNEKVIKYEFVEKDINNSFEVLEESGIEKWIKIEPPLDFYDESSEENSSISYEDEDEDKTLEENSSSSFEDEDESLSEYKFEFKDEIYEDEMSNNEENQIDLTDDDDTINNYFEIIENIEDEIVDDKIENYTETEAMNWEKTIPVTIEENNKETINVEVEIYFELGSNQKCFKIYEILDENNNEETLIDIPSQNKELMCSICLNYFKDKPSLLTHNLKHNKNKDIHKCFECHKIFDNQVKLKKHFRYHNKQNIVKISKKKFRGLSSINASENSLNCTICHLNLKTKQTLKNHIKTHLGEQLHKCEACDYATNRSNDLKRHKEKVHLKFKVKKKSKRLL